MIVEGFLNIVGYLLNFVFILIPKIDMNIDLEPLKEVVKLGYSVNNILPVNHFFAIAFLMSSFYVFSFTLSLINWIIRKIPTVD